MTSGERHRTKRKSKRDLKLIDDISYAAGIIGPIMTIPQAWQIWIGQNASGVSLISWVAYLILVVFWFFYGIAHREKPLILTYIFWIIVDAIVVLGILLYG